MDNQRKSIIGRSTRLVSHKAKNLQEHLEPDLSFFFKISANISPVCFCMRWSYTNHSHLWTVVNKREILRPSGSHRVAGTEIGKMTILIMKNQQQKAAASVSLLSSFRTWLQAFSEGLHRVFRWREEDALTPTTGRWSGSKGRRRRTVHPTKRAGKVDLSEALAVLRLPVYIWNLTCR